MTNKPFPEAFTDLLEERDISIRQFSEICRARWDGWGSNATLSHYRTGRLRATPAAIERIALTFDLEPTYFPEYRLAVARDQLDPEQVGLPIALANLRRFER